MQNLGQFMQVAKFKRTAAFLLNFGQANSHAEKTQCELDTGLSLMDPLYAETVFKNAITMSESVCGNLLPHVGTSWFGT